VPDFRIFPGSYIAALCPSAIIGATVAQVFAARSRTAVTAGSAVAPASITVPLGRRKVNG
jgi:hypothetical protein